MLRTRLTELLECDHPVMLAGMGGVSYSDLVAAVSEAGGYGTMGAAPLGLDGMSVGTRISVVLSAVAKDGGEHDAPA